MKPLLALLLALPLTLTGAPDAAHNAGKPPMVILNEAVVKNLGLETYEVEERDFEETVFALGRIEPIPGRTASVSSRIPGRVVRLKVAPGDMVAGGEPIVEVESRQPGNPPPVVALKSPISGLVTRMETQLGDPVEPDRALLVITDLRDVFAVARVPEHEAGRMKPGTRAHIRVAALPDEPLEGELLRFGTSADKQSGTLDAIFRIHNASGLLRADMRAEFSIVLSKRPGVLSVPRAALQGETAERFVYVRDFDLPTAFIKTKVQVGQINDRFVEIVSGLLPADEVVTRGAYSLSFAGAGSVSLKEALDAAHGHEHAEDGSELTPGKEAKATKIGHAADDHDHDHAAKGGSGFWKATSALLFIALVAALFRRRPLRDETTLFRKNEAA